ncbi:SGNH/GDSL hydrolase family protein [Aeromicrobium sp.]|uniref:SGNH/GDSL hydrolase family protein n=1 Tax=Aeromicrobium sp. TaxID=1871063 RepID=UPI003D6A8412
MSRSVLRIAVVIAIAVALLTAWQSARGGEQAVQSGPFQRGIVVVGDSITAEYNDDPGDPLQGWWSMVGRHFDANVTTHAQSGSGYLRQGLACGGNRFIDRPEAFRDVAPSLFIVQGGRNDWASCIEGRHVESRSEQVAEAVDHYFDVLQANLPRSTRIVVLGPTWGTLDQLGRQRITAIVYAAAKDHGIQYVSTMGTLDRRNHVIDGVHPNRAGSTALADRVIAALE